MPGLLQFPIQPTGSFGNSGLLNPSDAAILQLLEQQGQRSNQFPRIGLLQRQLAAAPPVTLSQSQQLSARLRETGSARTQEKPGLLKRIGRGLRTGAETFNAGIERFGDLAASNDPKLMLAMNLLAGSGPSFTPQGGLSGIANAFGKTQRDISSANDQQLRLQLLEAQIKSQGSFALSPGQGRFDAQGNPIASLPGLPQALKAPTTRNRIEGNQTFVEQFDPSTGQYVEVSRGPRFNDRPTTSSIVVPILDKLANLKPGERLSTGDQAVLDFVSRADALDRMLNQFTFGGGSGFGGGSQLTPDQQATVNEARQAITDGRDRDGVRERLRSLGIDPDQAGI